MRRLPLRTEISFPGQPRASGLLILRVLPSNPSGSPYTASLQTSKAQGAWKFCSRPQAYSFSVAAARQGAPLPRDSPFPSNLHLDAGTAEGKTGASPSPKPDGRDGSKAKCPRPGDSSPRRPAPPRAPVLGRGALTAQSPAPQFLPAVWAQNSRLGLPFLLRSGPAPSVRAPRPSALPTHPALRATPLRSGRPAPRCTHLPRPAGTLSPGPGAPPRAEPTHPSRRATPPSAPPRPGTRSWHHGPRPPRGLPRLGRRVNRNRPGQPVNWTRGQVCPT